MGDINCNFLKKNSDASIKSLSNFNGFKQV